MSSYHTNLDLYTLYKRQLDARMYLGYVMVVSTFKMKWWMKITKRAWTFGNVQEELVKPLHQSVIQ